jgi:transcriptional regulator with XRE-family HTH domain
LFPAVQKPPIAVRFRRKDTYLDLGTRIRTAREGKRFSQGDLEQRSGMLRCYISRVENGHTVPSIETLEKIARALDMKLYQLLYYEDRPGCADAPKRLGQLWQGSAPAQQVSPSPAQNHAKQPPTAPVHGYKADRFEEIAFLAVADFRPQLAEWSNHT